MSDDLRQQSKTRGKLDKQARGVEDFSLPPTKKVKRQASVYDATAGLVGVNGFLQRTSDPSQPTRNNRSLAPHEILLRRKNRPSDPAQWLEKNYSADERLSQDHRLPDSDLLKAIHTYAADFYAAATHDKGKCDFRSLDETALLAVGILLEEAAMEVLGETGDMVLVEPEELQYSVPEDRATRHQVKGRVRPAATPPFPDDEDDTEGSEYDEHRRKRYKHDQAQSLRTDLKTADSGDSH